MKVEQLALARLAQYTDKHCVHLYAFALEGSHYHQVARFPLLNRSDFARDFNSTLARGVDRLTPNYPGGRLWARRYSGEIIAGDADIEQQFFYTVLQPVKDGLVSKISEYPFYNGFTRSKHKEASHRYLAGDLTVEFPPGTYRPPLWLAVIPAGPFSVI